MEMSILSVQIITHPVSKNQCRYYFFECMNICGIARVFIQYLLGDQRQDYKGKQIDEVLRH